MKKYCLINKNHVEICSNTLEDIENERESLMDDLIENDESFLHLKLFEKIEQGDEDEYKTVLVIREDPDTSHHVSFSGEAYDADLFLERNEAWFGQR